MPASPKLQYYRRGCRRNFCSSGSNNNGDVVDRGFKEVARSVMTTCYNYGIGLGFGYGSGMYPDSDFILLSFKDKKSSLTLVSSLSAFILVRIFGGSNAERSKEIEWVKLTNTHFVSHLKCYVYHCNLNMATLCFRSGRISSES